VSIGLIELLLMAGFCCVLMIPIGAVAVFAVWVLVRKDV
jgi:hypothetical protein